MSTGRRWSRARVSSRADVLPAGTKGPGARPASSTHTGLTTASMAIAAATSTSAFQHEKTAECSRYGPDRHSPPHHIPRSPPAPGHRRIARSRFRDVPSPAFHSAERSLPGCVVESLVNARQHPPTLGVCASPAYLQGRQRPRQPNDLTGHQLISSKVSIAVVFYGSGVSWNT